MSLSHVKRTRRAGLLQRRIPASTTRRKRRVCGSSPQDEVEVDIECYGVGAETECLIPSAAEEANGNGGAGVSSNGNARSNGIATSTVDAQEKLESPSVSRDSSGLASSSPFLLLSPFFCWGTAMVAMRSVVAKSAPFFVAAHRLVPAGALLLVYRALTTTSTDKPIVPGTRTAWVAILVFAAVDATMFQGFLAKGLETTGAGLGSVIIDSQPITVFILASIFLNEKITSKKLAGLAVGVVGLLLLEVEPGGLGDGLQLFDGAQARTGEFSMLLAAQSMAIGTVLIRWVSKHADPVAATGWHLLLGGLPLAALSIIYEDGIHIYSRLNALDVAGLVYTSVFGCAVGYGIFFALASRGSLTKLSSLTFTTPIFASLFGYLLLGETLSPVQVAGGAVTLAGVSLIV